MLTLRLSTPGDVAELAALELAADTGQWLGETGRAWHERALADPDQEHLAAGEPGALRGFAVLAGLCHRDRGIELRRMVVAAPFRGTGQGRALLRAALTRACCHHRARRVWLDVKPGNLRARSLYESEGFTVVALPAHGPDPRGATGLVVMERACPGE
ncbi:MAG: GNAT family N-acetyltransferase [Gemmatimonadota bacterium]